MVTQKQLDLLDIFFHHTAFVPFDRWDWDVEELLVFLNQQIIERYSLNDLNWIIKDFEL